MIKEKYGIAEDMYELMPREERNLHLRHMLECDNIIIFPDEKNEPRDGIPQFTIIYNDLKEIKNEIEKKQE